MHVSELYLHPLKSAAAIHTRQLVYSEIGPNYDRFWVAVDSNGVFMTQRKHAKMCLISPTINGDQLLLSAPDHGSISINASAQERCIKVWQDTVTGADCGDEAAGWLSRFLGVESRLVALIKTTNRAVDPDYAKAKQIVSFADGFPSLVVSEASLTEFNRHLDSPVDMRRFRPNIVIAGCDPYAEDRWKAIKINGIVFELVKPCSRCIMPSINPDTAAKEMAVNDALMKTRRRERKTYFGQNALHNGIGTITVGDAVQIIA